MIEIWMNEKGDIALAEGDISHMIFPDHIPKLLYKSNGQKRIELSESESPMDKKEEWFLYSKVKSHKLKMVHKECPLCERR